MLKKKMIGTALCFGILTGGGTLVGHLPVQAAESMEMSEGFVVFESDWSQSALDNRFLIHDCSVNLAGYSDNDIIHLLALKKGDKVQMWVTGDGSIRESYPGQLTGTVFKLKIFKLKNMRNGKIIVDKNISTEDVKRDYEYNKISQSIGHGAISSELFSNKTTEKNGGWLTGKISVNSDGTYFRIQKDFRQPDQYVNVNLEGYTNQQVISYFKLRSGDTISVQYENIREGNPLTLMATSIKKRMLAQIGALSIDPREYQQIYTKNMLELMNP